MRLMACSCLWGTQQAAHSLLWASFNTFDRKLLGVILHCFYTVVAVKYCYWIRLPELCLYYLPAVVQALGRKQYLWQNSNKEMDDRNCTVIMFLGWLELEFENALRNQLKMAGVWISLLSNIWIMQINVRRLLQEYSLLVVKLDKELHAPQI